MVDTRNMATRSLLLHHHHTVKYPYTARRTPPWLTDALFNFEAHHATRLLHCNGVVLKVLSRISGRERDELVVVVSFVTQTLRRVGRVECLVDRELEALEKILTSRAINRCRNDSKLNDKLCSSVRNCTKTWFFISSSPSICLYSSAVAGSFLGVSLLSSLSFFHLSPSFCLLPSDSSSFYFFSFVIFIPSVFSFLLFLFSFCLFPSFCLFT
jgi:hypothetical protein